MSSPTSSPNADSSWKHKYEILKAQYAVSKDVGPKEKRCVSFVPTLNSIKHQYIFL
jgi:hypothetical protein